MKVLLDILRDSQAHYQDVEADIQKRLVALPRGSVFKRRLGRGSDYYYRVFRQGPKVISQYVGKDEPRQLLKDIEERRLLNSRLKEVRQSLGLLRRLRWDKPRAKRHR